MNDKFFDLDVKKQNRIINAAMEVFTNHGYKRASTDEIVKKAEISKGLLFHYFGSKKNLYLFLFDYSMDTYVKMMDEDYQLNDTDFFHVIQYYMNLKLDIQQRHHYLYGFIMKVYMEKDPQVEKEIRARNTSVIHQKMGDIMSKVDMSKFKEELDIKKAVNTIIWSGKSFAQENVMNGNKDLKELKKEFEGYLDFYKQCFYREEFIT